MIGWAGGVTARGVILSGRWFIWWTVSSNWVGFRGDGRFFLVGGSFCGLCQVIGWVGGVMVDSFWSVVYLGDLSLFRDAL